MRKCKYPQQRFINKRNKRIRSYGYEYIQLQNMSTNNIVSIESYFKWEEHFQPIKLRSSLASFDISANKLLKELYRMKEDERKNIFKYLTKLWLPEPYHRGEQPFRQIIEMYSLCIDVNIRWSYKITISGNSNYFNYYGSLRI